MTRPSENPAESRPDTRTAQRRIAAGFALTALGAIGFAVIYGFGGQPQLEGVALAVAFGGLAFGFGWWTKLMPQRPVVEEREPMTPPPRQREATAAAFERRDEPIKIAPLPRRMLTLGLGALGVALVFPLRSLLTFGPRPVRALHTTPWRKGARAVTEDGRPVRPGDLAQGTVLTVFPEGHTKADDAMTLLIRVDPAQLQLPADHRSWVVDGVVAYSKLCTHAGCPVGLYTAQAKQLLCPCHQSVFDVLDGAKPVGGPAARALPQLPLGTDAQGYLVAEGDFPRPPGPGFWSYS